MALPIDDSQVEGADHVLMLPMLVKQLRHQCSERRDVGAIRASIEANTPSQNWASKRQKLSSQRDVSLWKNLMVTPTGIIASATSKPVWFQAAG